MADMKISQLGAATTVTDSDVLPMTANGTTVKVAASLLKEYVIGDSDISGIGDGSPTGAIDVLYTLVSRILGDFATVEVSTTATRAYKIGDYLIMDGLLYRVTAAIANADTITVGTNVVLTTVAEEVANRTLYFTNQTVLAGTGDILELNDDRITADHVCISCVWGNPSYITTDVNATTTAGTLTLNGTCSTATTADIVLVKKDN